MRLAEYQTRAVAAAIEAFKEKRSVMLVLATGLGKTIVFCDIAKHFMDTGRVLILAHRHELIEQAASKVRHTICINPAIEKAERYAPEQSMYGKVPIVVSSVQTQISGHRDGRRMHRFDPSDFSLVIVDECHHAAADSYRSILEHYQTNPDCKVLGVTATPDRKDQLAMGMIFESCPFTMGIEDGRNEGYLVPILGELVQVTGLDLSACKTTAGDLNQKDLAKALSEDERVLQGFASGIVQHAGPRKTLVFADSVANAENLTSILNGHRDGSANLVIGKTPQEERYDLIKNFREGKYQYLVNVGVATEGFDVPDISCVALCRPTKSRALFAQMIGRGTRPVVYGLYTMERREERIAAIAASEKPNLLVLDFVGVSGKHKLVHLADVLGGKYTDEERKLAERRLREGGKPSDVAEELEKARQELATARAKQASKVVAKARTVTSVVDLFDSMDLRVPHEPMPHRSPKPTEKQVATLERWGIKVPETMTRKQASAILGKWFDRMDLGLCTYKQFHHLKKMGYDPENMTMKEASDVLSAKWGARREPAHTG